MQSQRQLVKFGLQILVGLVFAVLVLTLLRGQALPFALPSIPIEQTQWIVLGLIFVGIAVASYFADDKFSLYVASMFLLVSLFAVYAIVEILNFTKIGVLGWALIIFISFVGSVRIYFQRQL